VAGTRAPFGAGGDLRADPGAGFPAVVVLVVLVVALAAPVVALAAPVVVALAEVV